VDGNTSHGTKESAFQDSKGQDCGLPLSYMRSPAPTKESKLEQFVHHYITKMNCVVCTQVRKDVHFAQAREKEHNYYGILDKSTERLNNSYRKNLDYQ